MNRRTRRPYEKQMVSKRSALLFGLGLGALLATVAILAGLLMPNFSTRLDNAVYRARSYYRKLMPHPAYLPTPVLAASNSVTPNPLALNPARPSRTPSSAEAIPAAAHQDQMPASPIATPTVTATPLVTASLAAATSPVPSSLPATPIPPAPTPTLPPTVALRPVQNSILLTGLTHQWQTWNNCGPATVTMAMSYFGHSETQVEAAKFLKPNRDDKNVSPDEMAAYARTTGMAALVRHGGSLEQLKLFVSNDFPVLTETWLLHDGDGLGHYRLVIGYDDATRQLVTYDSLNGPNTRVDYDQFEADWRVFNRVYVILYPPEQADTIRAIVGPDMDDAALYGRLVTQAQAELAATPNDPIAYFNQGDALTVLGRYEEAAKAFDEARRLGLHWRRLWYQFTPFEAYYAIGRYQDVIDLATATLKNSGGLEEAYYYRGLALHATGQPGAREDFEAALAYNPNFAPAQEALNTLSP